MPGDGSFERPPVAPLGASAPIKKYLSDYKYTLDMDNA